jgi:4-hydroxy-3-methylbut-2-enyl diphosphate reductase
VENAQNDNSMNETTTTDASATAATASDAPAADPTTPATPDNASIEDATATAPSETAPAAPGNADATGEADAAGNAEPVGNEGNDALTGAAVNSGSSSAEATAQAAPPEAAAPSAPRAGGKQPSMAQVMEMDEFSSYMSGVDTLQRGALMRGMVVRKDDNTGEVMVDIGSKSEGIVARNEMGDEDVNVGDEIEVVVLRPEDDEGHPVLSKRRADYEKTWRELIKARDEQTDLEGTVREQVKGGLIVDLGVPAFVPASHVDARNRSDLSRFVGRTIPIRVIEIDKKKNKVIGSHRLAAEKERKEREEQAWGSLEKDKIVEGVVRRITDFGAFIDLGGVDGLLHVREMAWNRVEHPDQVVKKGQKLQVLVLEIDEERKRVALGLKQLQSDPWKKAAKNYRTGQMVTGKIVRIAPSCAFVELEEGVEGIIPIGEMSETRINTPEDVLSVGQEVEARIKQIQTNQRRITLSLKAAVQERETRETRTVVRQVNERATEPEGLRLGDVFGEKLRAARDRGRERNEARSTARARALEAAEAEEDETDWDAEVEEVDTEEIDNDVNDEADTNEEE